MGAPTIRGDVHIQIIRFELEPGQAEQLISVVSEQLDGWVRDMDGFLSANFHVSDDERYVINYAQWETREAFDAFTQHLRQPDLVAAIQSVRPKQALADAFSLKASILS